MPTESSPPDPAPVLDLIEAFRRSKAMFAAVSLGVFDRLAQRPASLPDLARDLGCHADSLSRLLDACVGLGLLIREGAGYANTPAAAAYLCATSPHRLTGYIRYSDAVLWDLWDHLDDAVREGTHRWRQSFGLEGPLFDHFFRNDHEKREFLLGMHGMGQLSSPAVVAAFDLSPYRRLVDLGGATGHLAIAACRRYPALRAVVFDLPGVTEAAREVVAAAGMADRVEVVAGDFFRGPLPQADLFALGRILHDWSEDKVRLLLRAIYDRLPSGGAVLIAEKLLDDDRAGPSLALFQSLNMLVCTEGKERTLSEYEALLRGVGFRRVEGRRTNSPLDAVLAAKA
jgi:acetylserotonin N-methyltransferase